MITLCFVTEHISRASRAETCACRNILWPWRCAELIFKTISFCILLLLSLWLFLCAMKKHLFLFVLPWLWPIASLMPILKMGSYYWLFLQQASFVLQDSSYSFHAHNQVAIWMGLLLHHWRRANKCQDKTLTRCGKSFFFFINLLILQLLVYNFNQSLRIGNHSGCMQRDMSNSPYCKNCQINVEM